MKSIRTIMMVISASLSMSALSASGGDEFQNNDSLLVSRQSVKGNTRSDERDEKDVGRYWPLSRRCQQIKNQAIQRCYKILNTPGKHFEFDRCKNDFISANGC